MKTNYTTIDTHCHVQGPQYENDRQEVIDRAQVAGVAMVCVGTDFDMSQKAVALAVREEYVWASVGLHPNDNLDEPYNQDLYRNLAQHPKVVAIGEIGLDYYRTTDDSAKKFQKERFIQQLALADELQKPVIIHCRDAHSDMQQLLSGSGVIHSFTGTKEDALLYIKKGFYIGFNGIVTFTQQYEEAIQAIPLDRILLETDAPYLTPVPYRGKRNEPMHIPLIAQSIAASKSLSVEEVIRATTSNAKRLFNI